MKIGLAGLFTYVGSSAGIYSFVRVAWGDIHGWWRQPRLAIEFDPVEDLGIWTLSAKNAERIQKVATVHIRNKRKTIARRCIAVLKLVTAPKNVSVEREFILHWADVDYSLRTVEPEPIDIGPERRRLDVAFTVERGSSPLEGAWVAIPIALSNPFNARQALLPRGEYRFRLSVDCENGKGCSREFFIVSPEIWTELSMRPAKG